MQVALATLVYRFCCKPCIVFCDRLMFVLVLSKGLHLCYCLEVAFFLTFIGVLFTMYSIVHYSI